MRTTLFDNGDFAYFVYLSPVPDPVGGHSLLITSRLKSSRRPDEEQVRFRACVDESGLQNLARLIESQLARVHHG